MLGSFIVQSNAPSPIGVSVDLADQFASGERGHRPVMAPRSIPDELPVSVQVEGTTFLGVYGIVGDTIELISPDFGEAVTALGAGAAQAAAERLLRTIARHEMETTGTPFMKDHPLRRRVLSSDA